jgi:hypothetical protein
VTALWRQKRLFGAENRLSTLRNVPLWKDFPSRIRFLRYILSMHGNHISEEIGL